MRAVSNKPQSFANTRKTGKEQYYTASDVVDTCLDVVEKHVKLAERRILEPCGGTGEFIEGLLRRGISPGNITSIDIEPKHHLVTKANYLSTTFRPGMVSISNPPFGRCSSLARKFFNHAAGHSDYICYLVPRAWRKWSLQDSLNESFHLIDDIEMRQNCFYYPDGSQSDDSVLQTVFQVWKRADTARPRNDVPDHGLIKKVRPKNGIVTGANFEIIVFGWSCGRTARLNGGQVPAKTTTMYLDVKDPSIMKELETLDYSRFYRNVSTVNSLSLDEINWLLNERLGLQNYP